MIIKNNHLAPDFDPSVLFRRLRSFSFRSGNSASTRRQFIMRSVSGETRSHRYARRHSNPLYTYIILGIQSSSCSRYAARHRTKQCQSFTKIHIQNFNNAAVLSQKYIYIMYLYAFIYIYILRINIYILYIYSFGTGRSYYIPIRVYCCGVMCAYSMIFGITERNRYRCLTFPL